MSDSVMLVPFIMADTLLWVLAVICPRRFWKYSLSMTLAADAVKTEISKRLLLEEIAGGSTPFLRVKMPETTIYVKMLGAFKLKVGGRTVDCYDIGGPQCTLLLANLLLYRRRLVSTQEIAGLLVGNAEVDDPKNTVKSVVFRIRKAFKPFLGDDIIVTNHGSYSLNPKYQFILDISRFELFCSMAKKKYASEIERLALLEYSIRLYRGDLLPGLESEASFLGHITYYRLLFDSALESYFDLMIENGKYTRVFRTVATLTARCCVSPEVHASLIRALVRMNRCDLARSYYDNARSSLSAEALSFLKGALQRG